MSAYERMQALKCFSYRWIGQSFEYCDGCGKPYWEHTHVTKQAPGKGIGYSHQELITPESRAHVRKTWEGHSKRAYGWKA